MTTRTPPNEDQSHSEAYRLIEAEHLQLAEQNRELVARLRQLEQMHAANLAAVLPAAQPAVQQLVQPADHVPPTQPQNNQPVAEVNAVRTIRIPPFWSGNPALWFAQVEATFALNNINGDATRFRHVITQLDSQTLPAIADIIINPPATDKYAAIKARIMSSFAETSESKLRKLLRGLDPCNDKPTILLQRIRHLADGQVGDALLRTLFLEQLPEYVRGVLAISGDLDLSALALQADKVMEATRSTNVCAVQQQQPPVNQVSALSNDGLVADLLAAVHALTNEVKALKLDARSRPSSSRARSSSRHRATTPSSSKAADTVCYFHAKFGDNARKCQQPCSKPLLLQEN